MPFLIAGASLAAAFVIPGLQRGQICLPISLCLASVLVGLTCSGVNRRFGLWTALALAGQAVALQMIDAGRLIHYQHWRPFGNSSYPGALLLGCLLAQAVLVAGGLRSARRSWRPASKLILVTLLLLTATGAAPSPNPLDYLKELLFAGFVALVNLGNVFLIGWSVPAGALAFIGEWKRKLLGERGETVKLDRFVLAASCWIVLACAFLAFFSYQRFPHIQDEAGYSLNARYFAAGMLTMPAPPVPDAFNFYLMEVNAGRWYCSMPPGWPAVLAVGVVLGLPWLVNPLLAGGALILAYLLVGRLYDRFTARLVVLLLCCSPWYVFMGMNFMTHTLSLFCALAAALALVEARRTGSLLWPVTSGLAIGAVFLVRPLEGVIVGGLLGLWSILGSARLRLAPLVLFALAGAASAGVHLAYNKAITGDPRTFPVMAYFDNNFGPGVNALGFGPDRGLNWGIDPFPGHGLRDVVVNSILNLFSVNIELFGWSTGSLLLFPIAVASWRRSGADGKMLLVIAVVVVAHAFYWFSGGPDFGARYWYLIVVPCAVLAARGMQALAERFQGSAHDSARVYAAAGCLCLLALANYFPWRATDKYYHYLNMRPDIGDLASTYQFGKSLVFIRGERFPDYSAATVYNPIGLDSDGTIYALDQGPESRGEVERSFPGRPVWILAGPSITGDGYRVVQRPER